MIAIGERETGEDEAVRLQFRRVFDTPEGRQVLTMILQDLFFFDVLPSPQPEWMALRNYGIRLLERCGITHETHLEKLVGGLFKLPVYVPDAKKEDPRRT